jgi:hypothetical protein
MKKILVFVLLLLSFNELYSQKDTAFGGIYITNIYDLDIKGQSVCVDFWFWLNSRDSASFEDRIEIPGAKNTEFSNYYMEEKGGYFWAAEKCKAELYIDWNIKNYPFDNQMIKFRIEETEFDTTAMVYITDSLNSKLDSTVRFSEWNIASFKALSTVSAYSTTYGDPTLTGESYYPAITIEIVLDRVEPWMAFFKMLTGVYVAFLISVVVFFIKPTNVDPRFGLCVGGLFASVGNKYVVENSLPSSATSTLIDNIHNLTFLCLLLIVSISIFSLYLYEKDEKYKKWSQTVDRLGFWVMIVFFGIANYILISRSLYQ